MKLQIGMRVKINDNVKLHLLNAGKIKTITKELPDFGTQRAFALDNDNGIWCLEDFDYCVDYPDQTME